MIALSFLIDFRDNAKSGEMIQRFQNTRMLKTVIGKDPLL
ncbi:MAG: hypothetical protein ACI83B_000476 [Sediminicola sp.]|jgi:hypothetical protein